MSVYYQKNNTWTNMALEFYPIGSFYQGTSETSPAEIMGGTWNRVFTNYTTYEGLLSNAGAVVTNQRWEDIVITGSVRSGVANIRAYRAASSSSALISSNPNDSSSIMGSIDTTWAPTTDIHIVIGYLSDGSWLTLSVYPNGDVRIWARFCPSSNTSVSQFDGTVVYPVKSLNPTNAPTVIWKRIS